MVLTEGLPMNLFMSAFESNIPASYLVPGVTIGAGRAHFAVQAVGVGSSDNLGHQRRKPLAVVGL